MYHVTKCIIHDSDPLTYIHSVQQGRAEMWLMLQEMRWLYWVCTEDYWGGAASYTPFDGLFQQLAPRHLPQLCQNHTGSSIRGGVAPRLAEQMRLLELRFG